MEQSLSHRLQENLHTLTATVERLRSSSLDAETLREESLVVRLVSIQLGALAQDVSYQQIYRVDRVDRKKLAANDNEESSNED